MRLGLAVLVVPACVAAPDTGERSQHIIGGQTATTTAFPTTVALENSPGNWFCTGTLIDKDWVLTAAHCLEGETAGGLKIRFDDNQRRHGRLRGRCRGAPPGPGVQRQ
jgi:secreted trypsin-like serine protease